MKIAMQKCSFPLIMNHITKLISPKIPAKCFFFFHHTAQPTSRSQAYVYACLVSSKPPNAFNLQYETEKAARRHISEAGTSERFGINDCNEIPDECTTEITARREGKESEMAIERDVRDRQSERQSVLVI